MALTPEEQTAKVLEMHRQKQLEYAADPKSAPDILVEDPREKAREILNSLHEGEPFFVFRAQDILSSFALDTYADLVGKFNPAGDQEVSLIEAINSFREWQTQNPGKVKLPD